MSTLEEYVQQLAPRFGVLAESNTYQLTVIAGNTDVAVGDLFLLPCDRGAERFYIFRTTQYANIMNRTMEMNDVARNKLTMEGSYFSEDWGEEKLIELKGIVLGYSQRDVGNDTWSFHRPRRLPQHLTDVYHVAPNRPEVAEVVRELMQSQLGTCGIYIGDLLAGEQPLTNVPVYLPSFAFSHHIGVFGRTGCGKSNLMMVLLLQSCSTIKHYPNQAFATARFLFLQSILMMNSAVGTIQAEVLTEFMASLKGTHQRSSHNWSSRFTTLPPAMRAIRDWNVVLPSPVPM